MIGATDRGICFLQFGDSDPALLEDLRLQFPAATVQAVPDSSRTEFESWMAALNRHLAGPRAATRSANGRARHGIPADRLALLAEGAVRRSPIVCGSRGRDRQNRARREQSPEACATNSVALLIPCHRVVRGTGELGGYRWGMQRKRVLLDTERAASKR